MATHMFRNVGSGAYVPDYIIYGTVYVANETANTIVNFMMQDFVLIYNRYSST